MTSSKTGSKSNPGNRRQSTRSLPRRMIYLALCRIGHCEICAADFHLPPGDEVPERCSVCNSVEWLYGVEPLDGIKIRMGINRNAKVLNKGAKSKKRQDQGLRQWRRFGPKAVDSESQPKDN